MGAKNLYLSSAALSLGLHLWFVTTLWMTKLSSIISSAFKRVTTEKDGSLGATAFYVTSGGTYHTARFPGITHLLSKCGDNCTLVQLSAEKL